MKKLILSLLVAAFVGGNTLSAQTITKNEDGKYSLSVGHVTLTVDAQKGGKIDLLSLNNVDLSNIEK